MTADLTRAEAEKLALYAAQACEAASGGPDARCARMRERLGAQAPEILRLLSTLSARDRRIEELENLLRQLRVDDWYTYEGRLEASATHPVDLMDAIRAALAAEGKP